MMNAWVKFEAGAITQGPIASPDQPEGFVEYVEILNLPPGHGPTTATVALVDGKCVKTVTGTPDYRVQRAMEYPPASEYLDGVVKGDKAQIDAYIAACQAVKDKYPKPSV